MVQVSTIAEPSSSNVDAILAGLTPFDDVFLLPLANGCKEIGELLLRIVPNAAGEKVTEVTAPCPLLAPGIKGSIPDIRVDCESGNVYLFEVQRDSSKLEVNRFTYVANRIDAMVAKPGQDYSERPDTTLCAIYQDGGPAKETMFRRIALRFEDEDDETGDEKKGKTYWLGEHQYKYVLNGAYEDTEETGRTLFGDIMHDFRCSDPDKMRCPEIRERAIFLKQREEGRKIMSKAIREAFKTELEEACAAAYASAQADTRREIARNLIAQGLPYPAIAEGTGLSEDEVRAIAGEDDKSAA